ncbi:hypothetical protein TRFO_04866 [Tritrichomonas foetus]|uniref:Uncharacterized protein n=1 Tax=Tritrichomonas foetus TaxID=1144522 RepID=A0A1J4KFZ1_9EUKA|nr:hypothetical protein TRFO_04866 [Tritrichomonas foetus]|eukprot:OHT08269.1 hypothetical protein TRFO_04866 [Tritrichomonas foetus]
MSSPQRSPKSPRTFDSIKLRHTTKNVVTPFNKQNSPHSNSSPVKSPSVYSSPSKMVTKNEFDTMLEYDPLYPPVRNSKLSQSLYELSVHLRTVSDVRDQILYFRDNAPLVNYKYSCVTDLLFASAKCPPDMLFFLLTMAAKMVKLGNVAPAKHLRIYIKICQHLLLMNYFFISFKVEQDKAKHKIRKMLALFQGVLAENRTGKSGKLSTRQIEKYLESRNVELLEISDNENNDDFDEDKSSNVCLSVSNKNGTLNYKPKIDIDELASVRLDVDPDHYTKEEQNSINFISELNAGIPLASLKNSMKVFLASKDDLFERRKRGATVIKTMNQDLIRQILRLVSLFASWDVAYDASLAVWEVMQKSDDFDVDALLSQLPVSYGDFLVEALKTFAEASGLQFTDVDNPY